MAAADAHPPSLRQAQGARSREEILDAAEALMGARGYAASSISALAKASGLPASSIYWHFGSKSGVLGAVMERGSQRFFADVAAARATLPEDPRDRLADLWRLSVRTIRAHPQFLRLFIVLLLGAEGDHAQDEVVGQVRHRGAELMRRGIREAYEPWGTELAARIGDELGDLAMALFDGLFIALEAPPRAEVDTQAPAMIDRAVTALHATATTVRDAAGRP